MRSISLFKAFHPVLCIALLGGIGNAFGQPVPLGANEPPIYPTLQGRFADEPIREPLVALEAFAGESDFYISYRGGDGIVYAGGNWSSRIDLEAITDAGGAYSGPYILPIEYQQRERWVGLPQSQVTPRLLSIEQWRRFRNKLFASVLPASAKSGLVLYFDNDDYFLYFTEPDHFEARRLVDKPADYSVQESITFEEFLRRGLPQLKLFLAEEGVTERRILFSTGDTGAYSLPFLYVNLDLPFAAFLRYPSRMRSARSEDGSTQAIQSAGHLAQSHFGSLLVRPASSALRLLFVTTEAAAETVRPSWLVALESQPIPELHDGPGMDLEEWEDRLDRATGRPASKGTIDYLIDGEEYFTHLIDVISSARESILIRSYIFDNDDFAEKIGQLLRRRSREGVDVKILLDGLGTIIATGAEDESMPSDYVPMESVRLFLEEGSGIDVRQVRNPWLTGDHVKTTIIDNEIAYVGGMNIGREYRYVWHDMMMATRGPVVNILTEEFYDAWEHAGPLGDFGYFLRKLRPRRTAPADNGYSLRVLHTRPGDPELFRVQREAIRNAKRYIFIQNAYFSDDTMLYELARARRRGVDVRVILPLVSNHGALNQSNVLAANAMLEHGIRVFLYPGMSHVKAAVFDGWVCLGSANWDKLSFRTNRELNLATSHPDAVEALLERIFTKDFGQSVELTEPFPVRWSDRVMEIVADYML